MVFKSILKVNNVSKDKRRSNSIIILLYIYQYGLMLPFSIVADSNFVVVGSTGVLLIYSLIKNGFCWGLNTYTLILAPIVALMIKMPFEYTVDGVDVFLEISISYLTIGVSGILVGSLYFDEEGFIELGYKLGWVNYLISFSLPFTSIYNESVNYMKYGYAVLPSVLFAFVHLLRLLNRRYFTRDVVLVLLLFVLSLFELVVFGARGCLLVVLSFMVLVFFIFSKVSIRSKIIVSFLVGLLVFKMHDVVGFIIQIFADAGIHSYSLAKILNLMEEQTLAETSSGRDVIYQAAFDRIFDSPIFGSPINSSFIDTGSTYYHNIFLDIAVNFGLVILLCFVVFLVISVYYAFRKNDSTHLLVFLILFSIPFGRLLVSSSYWQRPEFWLFLAFCRNQGQSKGSSLFSVERGGLTGGG